MKKSITLLACIASIFYANSQSIDEGGGAPLTSNHSKIGNSSNTPAKSGCSTLFADDFENGFNTSWTVIGGNPIITNTNAAQGSSSLEYTRTTGSSTFYSGVSHSLNSITPSYIKMYVKTNNTGLHNAYCVIGDANVTSNHGIIFFYIQNSGNIRVSDGSSYQTYPATVNTWYLIEFKNIDFVNGLYDYYIDGNLVGASYAFKNSATALNNIHLFNYEAGATSYFDDIEFSGGISVSSTLNNLTCSEDGNGQISLNVTNNSGPYTVNWTTGDTSQVLTGLSAGNYYVTVADSACTITDTITLTSTYISPSVDLGGDATYCNSQKPVALSVDSNLTTINWSDSTNLPSMSINTSGAYSVSVIDTNGCTASDAVTITFQDCTGIDEISNNEFKLYPSPNNGVFTIKMNNSFNCSWNMKIIDIIGQVVYNQNYNTATVNISAKKINKGTYFVKIESDDITITKKMIIK